MSSIPPLEPFECHGFWVEGLRGGGKGFFAAAELFYKGGFTLRIRGLEVGYNYSY